MLAIRSQWPWPLCSLPIQATGSRQPSARPCNPGAEGDPQSWRPRENHSSVNKLPIYKPPRTLERLGSPRQEQTVQGQGPLGGVFGPLRPARPGLPAGSTRTGPEHPLDVGGGCRGLLSRDAHHAGWSRIPLLGPGSPGLAPGSPINFRFAANTTQAPVQHHDELTDSRDTTSL